MRPREFGGGAPEGNTVKDMKPLPGLRHVSAPPAPTSRPTGYDPRTVAIREYEGGHVADDLRDHPRAVEAILR